MMGTDPAEAARFVQNSSAHILALNCGAGVDMQNAAQAVRTFHQHSTLPIMVQPNAGTPMLVGIKVVYRQTPEEMARDAKLVLAEGINILGSCCGSTPLHTRALRYLLDSQSR